ncbi:S8 family peptidase [Anabaenopsis elenkinii]|uniref:S8 family serine peptidase n=1 Tax=Anabaenopsis elenkinii CCIBt3563 TaxID=2779889 RepID=A0A7S6U3H0_9CYAN|nr:S8 family peptidase [Anabaenopsis elenkinii]QOV24145.1 S8 family serine peptidase [Anabaenopsis elenkinii CCIBt3563]
MPIDDISQTLFPHHGLNSTPISSLDTFQIHNDYSLSLSGRSSFNPPGEINGASVQTTNYNFNSGYGLINAAAAVARATGQNTFADVPALGGNNWGADLVRAPAAWAQGYTGKGVVVAVLDTGVDYNHPDLKDNIWVNPSEIPGNGIDNDRNGYIDDTQGWNFADNSNNVIDLNGHGTHVAGTIAGGNNGFGVTGIAYDAKIMPVKVLNQQGSGSSNAVAEGIYYAVNNGARVINLSLGSNFPNSTLADAIEYASSRDAVVIMASGNNGYPLTGYPARYANNWGLAVGAVDSNNRLANFSNRAGLNSFPYVTAPGVGIYSSLPGNEYGTYSGTSMAAPHVSGVVALMLSANPNLTHGEIRQIIMETAGNSSTARPEANRWNITPVVSETIRGMVNNITSINEINRQSTLISNIVNLAIADSTNNNTPTSNPPTSSLISPGLQSINPGNPTQLRYYHSSIGGLSSTNDNIFNADDIDQNNLDFRKIGRVFNQLRRGIDIFRRLLPIIRR